MIYILSYDIYLGRKYLKVLNSLQSNIFAWLAFSVDISSKTAANKA